MEVNCASSHVGQRSSPGASPIEDVPKKLDIGGRHGASTALAGNLSAARSSEQRVATAAQYEQRGKKRPAKDRESSDGRGGPLDSAPEKSRGFFRLAILDSHTKLERIDGAYDFLPDGRIKFEASEVGIGSMVARPMTAAEINDLGIASKIKRALEAALGRVPKVDMAAKAAKARDPAPLTSAPKRPGKAGMGIALGEVKADGNAGPAVSKSAVEVVRDARTAVTAALGEAVKAEGSSNEAIKKLQRFVSQALDVATKHIEGAAAEARTDGKGFQMVPKSAIDVLEKARDAVRDAARDQ